MTSIALTVTPFTVTTPRIVDGFQSSMDSNNIMHVLANGRTSPVFRTPSLRKGTMKLVYDDESDSRDAELLFAAGEYFEVTDGDRPSIDGMVFAVAGPIGRELDTETRDVWIVSVQFEELDP